MATRDTAFEVLNRYEETEPLLNFVRNAADSHRDAFGFLAASVYEEFARKDCLYVLVERTVDGQKYVGHLLFTQRYPTARIVQMYTDPHYRRQALATRLIDHFRAELTRAGFTSIYASVAEDLNQANAFWEKQRFHIQAVRQGGEVRKRKILRRCHELESPQLFPASGIDRHNPLGLIAASAAGISLFLLDLNVLFDATGPRRVRHMAAVSLFQAERLSICRLAVSNEVREELRRTASQGKIDPMEGFVDILPSFPLKEFDPKNVLFKELTALVFPQQKELTKNDQSDLRHIATAIQHGLAGLITNDAQVLRAGPFIKGKYGIEVLSPDAFRLEQTDQQTSVFEGKGDVELSLRRVSDEDAGRMHDFLRQQGVSPVEIATEWFPTGANSRVVSRFSVWASNVPVGYITWSAASQQRNFVARVATDPQNASSDDAARIMLTLLLEQLPLKGPGRIDIVMPAFQSITRDIAIEMGFRGAPDHKGLNKIALGGVLTTDTWTNFRSQLQQNSAIKLPEDIPAFQHPDQQIPISTPDGNRRYISLDELESLLSPTLLCLPGRSAVITPIQRSFSEPLLGHSRQFSLLPANRVALFTDRHYISSPRTLPHFKRGTLIFFYESGRGGGRCAVVAMARVRQAYLKRSEEMGSQDLEHSVLDDLSVKSVVKSKTKTVTVFDNLFVLPRLVPLETLRRIGCGSDTQLISTNRIATAQVQEILQVAFGNG